MCIYIYTYICTYTDENSRYFKFDISQRKIQYKKYVYHKLWHISWPFRPEIIFTKLEVDSYSRAKIRLFTTVGSTRFGF